MQSTMKQPIPFVDAAGLTREEWLEYRKHGVCASDLPVIMELSGYKSVFRLFQEKMSRRPKEEIDQSVAARIAREAAEGPPPPPMFDTRELIIDPNEPYNLPAGCGHALEPEIAKYFSTLLSVPIYKDTHMYRHPDHPYLMVDNDYLAITPDPETGEIGERITIIECKSISWNKRDQVMDGPIFAHKVQAGIASNIMFAADAYIVYLFDNNPGGFIYHYMPRDYAFEASLVALSKNFWCGNVEKEILPIPTVPTDIARKEMAAYACEEQPYRPRPQLYNPDLATLVTEYTELQEERGERKEALDETERRIAAVKMRMGVHMLGQREAECGDVRFKWRLHPSRSCNYDGLKQAHPGIYAQFVQETKSPVFDVRMKQSAGNERKDAA